MCESRGEEAHKPSTLYLSDILPSGGKIKRILFSLFLSWSVSVKHLEATRIAAGSTPICSLYLRPRLILQSVWRTYLLFTISIVTSWSKTLSSSTWMIVTVPYLALDFGFEPLGLEKQV